MRTGPLVCSFLWKGGDIPDARNAGMIGVWKRDDYWGYAEADYIIDDLRELLVIIEEGVNRYGRI
jgi:putative hydrolase of the HAD superfamily